MELVMQKKWAFFLIFICIVFIISVFFINEFLLIKKNERISEETRFLREKISYLKDTTEIAIVIDDSLSSVRYEYIKNKDDIDNILNIISRARIDDSQTPRITTTSTKYRMIFIDESGSELLVARFPFALDDVRAKLEKQDEKLLNDLISPYLEFN